MRRVKSSAKARLLRLAMVRPSAPRATRRAVPRAAGRARRSSLRRSVPMRLIHANTGQRLTVSLFDRRGRVDRGALRKINRLFRCQRTGRVRSIALQLISNLNRISRAFGHKPIYFYSGYRSRKVERGGSYHTRGRAVDFRIGGVSNRRLRDYIRKTFSRVGVGYYPNSLFVHMDVRPKRSAFWIDFSGPGEPADYARNPLAVLRAENKRQPGAKNARVAPTDPPLTRATASATPPAPAAVSAQADLTAGPPPVGPAPEAPVTAPAGRLPFGIPPAAPW